MEVVKKGEKNLDAEKRAALKSAEDKARQLKEKMFAKPEFTIADMNHITRMPKTSCEELILELSNFFLIQTGMKKTLQGQVIIYRVRLDAEWRVEAIKITAMQSLQAAKNEQEFYKEIIEMISTPPADQEAAAALPDATIPDPEQGPSSNQ